MPVRVLTCPQGSPAWHAARRRRYGASELPQIAALSGSQARVWRGKLGQPEELDARFLEVGHALEPLALRWWAEDTGREVEHGPVLAETEGWLLSSWDGGAPVSPRAREPVEVKVIARGNPHFEDWTEDTIPGHVDLQVRQQLHLGEIEAGRHLDAGHVIALFLDGYGVKPRIYRLAQTTERREEFAEVWAPYPAQWHAAFVATRTPPPDAITSDVAVLVEPVRVTRRDATEHERALVEALATAEAERKAAARVASEAEKARNAIRDDLARRVGPDATVDGIHWKARKGHDPILQLEKP